MPRDRHRQQNQQIPANDINQLVCSASREHATCKTNPLDQINRLAIEIPDNLSQIIAQCPKSLVIHGIYRPNDYKSPWDLMIVIGHTQLTLDAALSCVIARTALADKLKWGQRSLDNVDGRRSTDALTTIATANDGDSFLYGTQDNLVEYATVQLQRTRAGRVLIDAANSSDSASALTWAPDVPNFSSRDLKPTLPLDYAPSPPPLYALTLRQRVQYAILKFGIDGAWQRITSLAVLPLIPFDRSAELAIHEIIYRNGRKGFADLSVLIGTNYVPLTVVASCSIGYAALGDLFTSTHGTEKLRLPGSAIRWTLKSLGLQSCETPYEITRLDDTLAITWKVKGSRREYYSESSPAGALLARVLSMSSPNNLLTSSLPFTHSGLAVDIPPPTPARPQIQHTSAPPQPPSMVNLSRPTLPEIGDSPAQNPSPIRTENITLRDPDTGRDIWWKSLPQKPQLDSQGLNNVLSGSEIKSSMTPHDDGILRRTLGWTRRKLCFA
jgi:hypothetical protein